MVSSRQVVEIIQKEILEQENTDVIKAFKQLIDRIELLEDLELNNMFSDFIKNDEYEREQARNSVARRLAEEVFAKSSGN